MTDNENKKKEPWRIVVFLISVAYIVFMWVRKDIAALYAAMPADQAAPLIATTIAVSLLKAAAIYVFYCTVKGLSCHTQKMFGV